MLKPAYQTVLSIVALVLPASAWADIYMWKDERGQTVISNSRPANPGKVRDFERVFKEEPRAEKSAPVAPHVATRSEEALLNRIDHLERELQSRTYRSPPPPSAADYGYYAAPPPPPPPDYYGYYDSGYSYPAYSYPAYVYPYAPHVALRPGFGFRHPHPHARFAHGAPVVRGGFAHRGRR